MVLSPEDQETHRLLLALSEGFAREARAIMRLVPIMEFSVDTVCPDCDMEALVGSMLERERGRLGDRTKFLSSATDEDRRDGTIVTVNGFNTRVERILGVEEDIERHRASVSMLVRVLASENAAKATLHAARARSAFMEFWQAFAGLGPLPYLLPIKRFGMILSRRTYDGHLGSTTDPIEPEPWMVLLLDAEYGPGGNLNGHVTKNLKMLLGARRAFLDAGWERSDIPWMVSYRMGSDSRMTRLIFAPTAAKAVAWAAASLSIAARMEYLNSMPKIRFSRVEGPAGPADVALAVRDACNDAVCGGPLVAVGRIMVASRSQPNSDINWTVSANDRRIAVNIMPKRSCTGRHIIKHGETSDTLEVIGHNVHPRFEAAMVSAEHWAPGPS